MTSCSKEEALKFLLVENWCLRQELKDKNESLNTLIEYAKERKRKLLKSRELELKKQHLAEMKKNNIESMMDKQSSVLNNKIKIHESEKQQLEKQIEKCHDKLYIKNLVLQIEENKTLIKQYHETIKRL